MKKRIQRFSIDWRNFKNSAKCCRGLGDSILAIGSIKAQLPRQKLAQRWCAEMRSFKFQISSMNSEWEAIKVLHSPLWITALNEELLRGNWRLCKRSWLFSSQWIVSCTLPKLFLLIANCNVDRRLALYWPHGLHKCTILEYKDFTEEHLKSWILDVFCIFFKYCENLDGERKSTPPMSCAEDRLKEE